MACSKRRFGTARTSCGKRACGWSPRRKADAELAGPDGTLVTDPAARHALVQRHSTPWSIAWHVLEVLDYDLAGEFVPWAPPPPFTGKRPLAGANDVALGVVAIRDARVRRLLPTAGARHLVRPDREKAATLLPPPHRYHGRPFAWELTALPLHTVEHASQIRQFITAADVASGADV